MSTGSGPPRPGIRTVSGNSTPVTTPVTRLSISLRDLPDEFAGRLASGIREALLLLSHVDDYRLSEACSALSLTALSGVLQSSATPATVNADQLSRVFTDASEVVDYVATCPSIVLPEDHTLPGDTKRRRLNGP